MSPSGRWVVWVMGKVGKLLVMRCHNDANLTNNISQNHTFFSIFSVIKHEFGQKY